MESCEYGNEPSHSVLASLPAGPMKDSGLYGCPTAIILEASRALLTLCI
jgi:hypothetical protein